MIERVILHPALLTQIEEEARSAYPRECCGLLVGRHSGGTVDIFLAHPATNVAERDDRFEIDPQAQFTLLHALRGTGREIIGCFHSHPNGRAEASPRDLTGASETGFLWLIAAVDARGACNLNAFAFNGREFRPVELCEPLSA